MCDPGVRHNSLFVCLGVRVCVRALAGGQACTCAHTAVLTSIDCFFLLGSAANHRLFLAGVLVHIGMC